MKVRTPFRWPRTNGAIFPASAAEDVARSMTVASKDPTFMVCLFFQHLGNALRGDQGGHRRTDPSA
jgi:hypothetical protein